MKTCACGAAIERPKQISVIRWIDQHYTYGPMTRSEMLDKCIGETVGYLITEDEAQVAIAAEWFEWRGDYRHVIHIPKCAILSHRKIQCGPDSETEL